MEERILWGIRQGEPDWAVEVISEKESDFPAAAAWALANGFDRLIVREVDLSQAPDFGATVAGGSE